MMTLMRKKKIRLETLKIYKIKLLKKIQILEVLKSIKIRVTINNDD